MKTLAVYSIKGGVGKTTTAVNLACLAASDNHSTLLCDLDAQGSASFYLRIRPTTKLSGKRFLRGGKKTERCIRGTDYDGLDLLPAALSFRNLDLRLDNLKRSKRRLAGALKQFSDEYDLLILDAPPNLTLLAENIFYAADVIVSPYIPTTLSMLSYERLVAFFKAHHLPRKKLVPFFSMVEGRKRLHRNIMQSTSAKRFLTTRIPYLSAIERMATDRTPVVISHPRTVAASAYLQLWQEIRPRLL
jgi:cellulose biosynthesis protein BcsQ